MVIVRMLLGLLPASRLKNRLLSLTGRSWRVHPTARVAPNLLVGVGTLEVGPGSAIGFANTFRGMRSVTLAQGCVIGQFNWFTGSAQGATPGLESAGRLVLDEHAGITSRHYLDCSGGLHLGRLSVVGGVRSVILTHGFSTTSLVGLRPVSIGEMSVLGARVTVTDGVTITDRCLVAAGSVVNRHLRVSNQLYAGNPAVAKRDITGAITFTRTGVYRSAQEREDLLAQGAEHGRRPVKG